MCDGDVCYLKPVESTENDTKLIMPKDTDEYTVYGASWCGFCRKAKKLLEDKQLPFVYYDVDVMKMDRKELTELTGQKTIPMVFHKTKFIGGYTDLVKILAKCLQNTAE